MSGRHSSPQQVALRPRLSARPPAVLVAALCMAAISSGVALPNTARAPGPRAHNIAAVETSVLTLSIRRGKASAERAPSPDEAILADNNPLHRACSLGKTILVRLWRGAYAGRSEDLIWVPKYPNYHGTFITPGHGGPWDYLQNVPLVLYGPKRIVASGAPLDRFAGLVDIYPTVGRLVGVDLEPRAGRVLRPALRPGAEGVPKLVVVVVWDGVGRDVLERWPDAWPTLKRLERAGTSFLRATVGSSPSNTPPAHSNIGTGTFPRVHGVTGIKYRNDFGELDSPLGDGNPGPLRVTTFADQVDQAFGGASHVGLVGYTGWHLGMLGHGATIPGGDADDVALIGSPGEVNGRGGFYTTPSYLEGLRGFRRHARILDRADGRADGKWRGHSITAEHDNPAWARYENDVVKTLMRGEGYGADTVPDILLLNYKMADIVGHRYWISSLEERDVLRAQDAALAEIVRYLDRQVRDYVVVVTADHGHTPPREETGAWPVMGGLVAQYLDRLFHVPRRQSLVEDWAGGGVFLDGEAVRRAGVAPFRVAEALNDFTIRDSWRQKKLPDAYEGRGREKVFSAVFPRRLLPRALECAFEREGPRSKPRS